MEIAIMVEGQNGLTWQRWMNIAAAVEDLGFFGLFRSDHFTNMSPPDKDSLELWVSLTWLASHTHRIQFGPLVTPLSFRHPVMTARMASAVDDLSGGRLTLGLGAGWQEREHQMYGFDLMGAKARFDRLEEGLKIIKMLFVRDEPFDFNGVYYQAYGSVMLPRPQRKEGPPILIGGIGKKRSLPLAAQYADEWNAMFLDAKKYLELNSEMDNILQVVGREPGSMKRSMMTGLLFGRTQEELVAKLAITNQSAQELRRKGIIVGLGDEIKDQLLELEKAGLQRIMLQWLDLDDLDGLTALAKVVL
ncbi:MAG: LLM class F420-dependent oxidoreductase [Chloroflexi bacterium GWB2_49_20]|nr:MAG: LLM class F420-dependent oxidoreductase [Chloroflexi bacterium GWB2_49_20]OGN80045.1 MAG: LLM class F420-dependent oxidoreductase [Chloroflexi bacterium GWC2_49_37]OGN85419.1 MAG: LLM class F420-dependent oxidoreductase [Chloroflexi bacterium GWD2_49_16]HCM97111.1 LLM class F420-dependent oxidoreductase [Anaerolineae bacterium]